MLFLALSILSSSLISVVFKLIGRSKIHTFTAIVINYFAACLAGFFLSSSNPYTFSLFQEKWFPLALIVGVMFIILFYLIGKSTQKAGIAVTNVAVKMSVVFPITFSIWLDVSDMLTALKITGIFLALVSVLLTVYRKSESKFDSRTILLPAFLFMGMGVVDSFVKYAQSLYITNEFTPIFSSVVFAISLVVGIIILPFNRQAVICIKKPMAWLLGIILGLANFGSMYFLILALNYVDISTGAQTTGSVVFGINNIGIVALTVIIGFLFFQERPSRINWVGISLSGAAILVLSVS